MQAVEGINMTASHLQCIMQLEFPWTTLQVASFCAVSNVPSVLQFLAENMSINLGGYLQFALQ